MVYCRTVNCFLKIWFNKRTHPNERRNGQSRHVVIHDVYDDTMKWATDQSAIRMWPYKYSMHQYSIFLQILGNWLIGWSFVLRELLNVLPLQLIIAVALQLWDGAGYWQLLQQNVQLNWVTLAVKYELFYWCERLRDIYCISVCVLLPFICKYFKLCSQSRCF